MEKSKESVIMCSSGWLTGSSPITKSVLYVEVVPKGFLRSQNTTKTEDEILMNMQDPLMTHSEPSPPPVTKQKNTKNKTEMKLKKKNKNTKLENTDLDSNRLVINIFAEEESSDLSARDLSDEETFPSAPCHDSSEHTVPLKTKLDWRKEKKELLSTGAVKLKNKYCCTKPNCTFVSPTLKKLHSHKRNSHKGREYQCDQCVYRGRTFADLRNHFRQHTDEQPYTCDVEGCGFKAKNNNSMVYHTNKYHPVGEPLMCEACTFTTHIKGQLKLHNIMKHGTGKALTCDVCPYKCFLKADLRKHHRVHTGECPYVCDFEGCKYACKISSNLRKHKRIHTKEKPYSCDMCEFRSNFINSLRVHKRTHTNERPYFCCICGYRCNHTSNLKKHVIRLHPGTPYSVTIIKPKPNDATSEINADT